MIVKKIISVICCVLAIISAIIGIALRVAANNWEVSGFSNASAADSSVIFLIIAVICAVVASVIYSLNKKK